MPSIRLNQKNYFPHQWDFLKSKKPIKALVGGFGSGKTFIFLRETFKNMINKKNANGLSNGWVIYPTYDLAEELFVQPFTDMLMKNGIDFNYNQSKHRFTTGYGNIKIYQLQKPQRIIGAELTYIGFDEFDVESYKNCDMAFKKSIGRMRGSEDCVIYIVTSPEGFGYTYKIFVEDNNKDRYLVHGKTTDNTYLPKSYIELLESNYDKNLLKAYRDGEFVNLQAFSTYHSFKNTGENSNVQRVSYNPTLPIQTCWDFNVSPMCCVLLQEHRQSPKIRIFDCIQLHHQGSEIITERMINTIKHKYPKAHIVAFPDASGGSRHTAARYSDHQLLRMSGFDVKVKSKNPPVTARVDAVNRLFDKNEMIIDPSCKSLIEDLIKTTNKVGTRDIDKSDKMLTHLSDALGYYCDYQWPVIRPTIGSIKRFGRT